ncbi:MAG: hypothetical protein HKN43_06375 [Rhodothermales bacterium]|nr:hypothetical protein [Rhodothermales bacterium]
MQGNFNHTVARESATGRTLLCVCPNSEHVVRAALSVFHRHRAPLLFVATLNQIDSDGGYTGWTPAIFRDLVAAEIERQEIDSPVFLCLDHGGPWKKRGHVIHVSHDECLKATKSSIRDCIEAGYSALHLDATGVNSQHQVRTDIAYQVDLTLHLQTFAEGLTNAPLSFEIGTRESGLEASALPLFKEFMGTYFDEVAARRMTLPTFCVGDAGTTSTPGPADPDRIRQLVDIASSHRSGLKIHFADDVPNLSIFPAIGVRAANIGPGMSAVEYAALHHLCNLDGVPQELSTNLDDAIKDSLVAAGLWSDLIGSEDQTSSQPLLQQRLAYASRYVWTAPDVAKVRAELNDAVSHQLNPDLLVQQRLEDYIANYLIHFGYLEQLGA